MEFLSPQSNTIHPDWNSRWWYGQPYQISVHLVQLEILSGQQDRLWWTYFDSLKAGPLSILLYIVHHIVLNMTNKPCTDVTCIPTSDLPDRIAKKPPRSSEHSQELLTVCIYGNCAVLHMATVLHQYGCSLIIIETCSCRRRGCRLDQVCLTDAHVTS